jgi:hypothetical protein
MYNFRRRKIVSTSTDEYRKSVRTVHMCTALWESGSV